MRAIERRQRDTEIQRLVDEGIRQFDVADRIGCSIRTVVNVVRRNKTETLAACPAQSDPPAQLEPPPSLTMPDATDEEIGKQTRAFIVRRLEAIEELTLAAEANLTTALAEGSGKDAKAFTITLSILIDKNAALIRSAKEFAPIASRRRIRQKNTLRLVDG